MIDARGAILGAILGAPFGIFSGLVQKCIP
jgi:hypothetical protein